MTPHRWRSLGPPIAFGSLVALRRLPVGIAARERFLVNVDELELTLSTIDRFLGVPPTTLAWPAGTLELLSLPGLVLHGLLSGLLELSPRGLVEFVGTLHAEPWSALTCVRLLVILASTAGLSLLAQTFSRRAPHPGFAYAIVALFAAVPLVWVHSHLAMADAVAVGFGATAIAALEAKNEELAAVLSGACLGLAVGAKFPIAILFPFLVGRLLESPLRRQKRLALLTLSLTLAALLVVPSIWLDPLRLAKSLLGNLTRGGAPLGIGAALLALFEQAPWLALAGAGGLGLLAWRRRSLLVVGSGTSVILAVALIGRSHAVAARYYLPVLLVLVAVTCHAHRDELVVRWSRSRASRLGWSLAGLLILGWGIRRYAQEQHAARATWLPRLAAADAVCRAPHGTKAFVHHELFPWVAHCASRDSLRRLASRTRENLTQGRSLEAFAASSLGADFVTVFESALSEDEQAFSARAVALSFRGKAGPIDVRLYGEDAVRARFGFDSEEDALSSLRMGEVDLVAARVPTSQPGGRPNYEIHVAGERRAMPARSAATKASPP